MELQERIIKVIQEEAPRQDLIIENYNRPENGKNILVKKGENGEHFYMSLKIFERLEK